MPALRDEVLEIVLEHCYRRLSTPVTLTSGEQSYDADLGIDPVAGAAAGGLEAGSDGRG